ncbi:MAG: class I SAM-dependent methyltransferase [Ignavibacteria bacterium]|nr:class I SAM-dependent methyltransferase [Ignavibacteria bacterium]
MVQKVKNLFWDARRSLKLIPIIQEMEELKKRGVPLEKMRALEMFGGYGHQITKDYAPYFKELEVWEIDPDCEASLRKNFPDAKIRIGDSYALLKNSDAKVDFVIADTALSDNPNEHFRLFPDIFRILNDSALVILNTVPEIQLEVLSKEQSDNRKRFYNTEDPLNIPMEKMLEKYNALCKENGFKIQWWFTNDRYFMYSARKGSIKRRLVHLVMSLERL